MRFLAKASGLLALAASALCLPGARAPAQAYTQTVLYSSCPSGVCNGLPNQQVLKSGSITRSSPVRAR